MYKNERQRRRDLAKISCAHFECAKSALMAWCYTPLPTQLESASSKGVSLQPSGYNMCITSGTFLGTVLVTVLGTVLGKKMISFTIKNIQNN